MRARNIAPATQGINVYGLGDDSEVLEYAMQRIVY